MSYECEWCGQLTPPDQIDCRGCGNTNPLWVAINTPPVFFPEQQRSFRSSNQGEPPADYPQIIEWQGKPVDDLSPKERWEMMNFATTALQNGLPYEYWTVKNAIHWRIGE